MTEIQFMEGWEFPLLHRVQEPSEPHLNGRSVKTGHSPPCSADVKKLWSFASSLPVTFPLLFIISSDDNISLVTLTSVFHQQVSRFEHSSRNDRLKK